VDGKRLTINVAVLAACAFSALVPAAAQAQACLPQSDVSALDQYCDSLPSSSGQPEPFGATHGATAPPLSTALAASEVTELRNSGMAGQGLLSLPSGRPMSTAGAERSVRSLPATRKAVEKARGGTAGGVIARTLSEAAPDTLSGAFRWGITLTTFGIAAMAWLRYRGRIKL
jgi:hypothetical protein